MFDDLRQKSVEEAEFLKEEAPPPEPPAADRPRRKAAGRKRGLTPFQRFVLALMLFLNVSVLGCFALIVFQKIMLPF